MLSHSQGANILLEGLDETRFEEPGKTNHRVEVAIIAHGDVPIEYLTGYYFEALAKYKDRVIFIDAASDWAFIFKDIVFGTEPVAGQLKAPLPGACLVVMNSSSHEAFAEEDYALQHLSRIFSYGRSGDLHKYFESDCQVGVKLLGFRNDEVPKGFRFKSQ